MRTRLKRSRNNKSDRRLERRDVVSEDVTLVCEDELGLEITANAQLMDVSPHGARFRTYRELPLNSSAKFYHRQLAIGGCGVVRYCNWSKLGFEIGMEFRRGTGWRGPRTSGDIARDAAVDHQQPVVSSH